MAKETRKPVAFDLGIILLITGATSNITLWIGAFVSSETKGPVGDWIQHWLLPILGGISGLAMSFTVAAGLVYVIARLNAIKPTVERKVAGKKKGTIKVKTMPNRRYVIGWVAVVLLMLISLTLLSPIVYMSLSGKATLFLVLGGWAGAWSFGRVLAADLALGAIALVHGVHLPSNAPASGHTSTATSAPQSGSKTIHTAKSATNSPTDTKGDAKELRLCDIEGCGIPYKWPQGKGAHMKQYHKDKVIRKGIPAGTVLPINQEAKK